MDKTIEGYIHQVSPSKTSRNHRQYFNAILQTGKDDYADVVCYGNERRSQFRQCAEAGSPVNVTLTPGKRRADASDIQCDKRVRLETAKLNFEPSTPHDEPFPLKDVKTCINEYQKITVKVKVLSKAEPEVQRTKSGTTLNRCNFTVADSSQTIQLTAWEKFIDLIEVEKSYVIKTATVRVFADVKYLNTNLDTTIKQVDDIGEVHAATEEFHHPRVLGRVSEVRVYRMKYCGGCKKNLQDDDIGVKTACCSNCHMRVRTEDLATMTFAKLRITDSDGVGRGVTCFGKTIDVLLASNNSSSVAEMGTVEIEEFFLDLPEMLYTINETDNIVMYINEDPL